VRNTAARLAHEAVEHRLRPLEICDHAVNKRCDDGDIARLASLHLASFFPDRDHLTRNFIDGDNGRLINHNATPAHRDDRPGRPHIYRHRIRDEIAQRIEPYQRARHFLDCCCPHKIKEP
jgi:hypothetical protein